MNYSKSFSYVFEDKDWVSKLLIAGLISLIPIVGWIYLSGWMMEIVRRVKAGRTDVLPRTHFSEFLTLGFKSWVVSFVYMLPSFILNIFTNFFNAIANNSSSDVATFMATGISCVIGLIAFVIVLFLSLLCFYGLIRLAETDKISECFKFGDVFRVVKANLKLFLLLLLMDLVASIICSAGIAVCFVGLIFTMPYSAAIFGHLLGQAWNNLEQVPLPVRNSAAPAAKAAVTPDIVEKPVSYVAPVAEEIAATVTPEVQPEEVPEEIIDVQESDVQESEPETEKPSEENLPPAE